MTKTRNRYVVLLAATACMSVSGAIYVWSIFNIPLAQTHGWDDGAVSLAYSLFLVISSVSFLASGWFVHRVHPRTLMFTAGTIFAIGWFVAGSAQSIPILYLGFCVMSGLADGVVYNTTLSTALSWFPDRRGFASGMCVGAVGLVPVIFAPLGNFLIEHFDVGSSFKICALLFLAIFWVFGSLLQRPPSGWVPEGWTPESSDTIKYLQDVDLGQAVRQPLFWAVWLMMLAATSPGLMLLGHTSDIGQNMVGITPAQAALQIAIISIASFAGRLGFGSLSDRIGRVPTLCICMVVTALDLAFGFVLVHDFASFSAALVVAGACFGGVMAVVPALSSDLFGPTHFGKNYALIYMGYTMSSLVGPTLVVWSYSGTGSYQPAFYAAAAIAVIGLALVLLVHVLARRVERGSAA